MCSKLHSITDLGQYKLYRLVTELHVSVNDTSIVAQSLQESTAGTSGGFRHVQHVRPNRAPPTKKGPPQEERQFFATQQHARNNGRHPSERVNKSHSDDQKRSSVFPRKIGSAATGEGPTHFFLKRALLRLDPTWPGLLGWTHNFSFMCPLSNTVKVTLNVSTNQIKIIR